MYQGRYHDLFPKFRQIVRIERGHARAEWRHARAFGLGRHMSRQGSSGDGTGLYEVVRSMLNRKNACAVMGDRT